MKTYTFPLNIKVRITLDSQGVRQAEIISGQNAEGTPERFSCTGPINVPSAYDLKKRKEVLK